VSIRLLQQLGVQRFIDYATRLGFDTSDFAPDLSLALGTHAMSPLEVAAAYAILANGGYRVEPYLIERIEDLAGTSCSRPSRRPCRDCEAPDGRRRPSCPWKKFSAGDRRSPGRRGSWTSASLHHRRHPAGRDQARHGRRALTLERGDIAGKTGTTNGPIDAWFSGYNPDVVTTTWVGFDDYGPSAAASSAAPRPCRSGSDYMREALAGLPERPARLPPGISHVRIDPDTGLLARRDHATRSSSTSATRTCPSQRGGRSTGSCRARTT
jgi:penicillin-binding protein 1A